MLPKDGTLARKKRFVVFSDDWGVHPSSCQHLFHHISREHDVSWINTIGMRSPRLDLVDFKKAIQKVGKMFSKQNKTQSENRSS